MIDGLKCYFVSVLVSPCDTCRHRQKRLDPEGCFLQVSTTGICGRFCRKIFKCERYGGV